MNSQYGSGTVRLKRIFSDRGRMFLNGSLYGEDRNNGTPLQVNNTTVRQLALGTDWNSREVGLFTLRLYGGTQNYHQTFLGSARESVKPRDSSGSAALAFIVLAATVAGGMWKPAFCAGFQALWESGESPTFDFSTISTTRHFHSEAGKQPNQALCAHRHAGGTVRG